MYYTVYKITNNINGKIYIGIHRTTNLNDGYMGSGKLLKQVQKKYGIENFTKELLEVFDNCDDMILMESILVNKDYVKQKNNYNLQVGGCCTHDNFTNTEYYKSEQHIESAKHAGMLGVQALQEKKKERMKKYLQNPKKCKNCEGALPYEKRRNLFCSHSCSASFNNKKRIVSEEQKKKVSDSLKRHFNK